MIDIQLNLAAETAKFVTPPVFKAGTTVAVRITLAEAPSATPVLELALSPQTSPPAVKCYLSTFAEDSDTVFLADWNTNDPRLIGFVANKESVPMNLAVRWTRAGKSREVPNLPVTVQQVMITGPETSETGPSYLSEAQSDDRYLGRLEVLDENDNINAIVIPRSGTAAQMGAIVPAVGERIYLTDEKTDRVGDGTTPGGNSPRRTGRSCVTLGVDSSTEGSDNATTARFYSNLFNHTLRKFSVVDDEIGRYPFTSEFSVGKRLKVFLAGGGDDSYFVYSTITAIDTVAQTITVADEVTSYDYEDGLYLYPTTLPSGSIDGLNAHAEGYVNFACGAYSHTEGIQNVAKGSGSHAEGNQNLASGVASHAEGANNIASGSYAHAEGSQTVATGDHSHAEGYLCSALFIGSHAGGYGAKTLWPYSMARGISPQNQHISIPLGGATNNATSTVIANLNISAIGLFACTLTVSGAKNDFSDTAMFSRRFLLKRTSDGTVSLVGTVQTVGTDMGSNAGAPPVGWAISVAANNTTKKMDISVTGVAATTIKWSGRLDVVHTS